MATRVLLTAVENGAGRSKLASFLGAGQVLSSIRGELDEQAIQFVSATNDHTYFTFAGRTISHVILVASGRHPKGAGDISLKVEKPIDWRQLPITTEALVYAADMCFTSSNRQTLFQQYLPADLQRVEWLEEWLRVRDISIAIQRLQAGEVRQVPAGLLVPLILPPRTYVAVGSEP